VVAKDEALQQLSTLLTEYNKLGQQTGIRNSATTRVMIQRFLAAIQRLTVPTSTYAQTAARQAASGASTTSRLVELAATVRALHDDIAAGWLASVVELAHADTYADYLEMAEGLHGQGYKDAAAVIAGTSLEVHLKTLAAKHGLAVKAPHGRSKKMDTLNAELKAIGVYNAIEHKQVTAWLGIRNSAAHGDYRDYDEATVKGLIDGVHEFALRYPA
jgi:hypothetical protein